MDKLLKQFHNLKDKHPNAILLFRTGDGHIDATNNCQYMCFNEDAQRVSTICDTPVINIDDTTCKTSFGWCWLDVYLPKLIRANCRIAICEPLEDFDKKVTHRLEKN